MVAESGYPLVFKKLGQLFVFSLARLIFRPPQLLWWRINGTERKRRDASLPENYERCVQVLNIVWVNKFDNSMVSSMAEYICTHDRFESPSYIFDNDHVSIFMVDKEKVVFAEAKEKDMLLWKTEYGAFIREAQVTYSAKLLVVPVIQFHRMADELGERQTKLILIYNASRCGSTLLSQMFEATEQIVTLSEPNETTNVTTLFLQEGKTPEMLRLAKNVIRWTCRPYKNTALSIYAIKPIMTNMGAYEMFQEVCPDSIPVFMYRNPIPLSISVYRVFMAHPGLRILLSMGKLSESLTEKAFNASGWYGPEFKVKFFDGYTPGFMLLIVSCNWYREMRNRGIQAAGIRFEDIIADPVFSAQQILKHCDLPANLTEMCVEGMAKDSQELSSFPQARLKKITAPVLTPESRKFHNNYLKKNGLPLIEDEFLLDGTITHKK